MTRIIIIAQRRRCVHYWLYRENLLLKCFTLYDPYVSQNHGIAVIYYFLYAQFRILLFHNIFRLHVYHYFVRPI